MTLRIGILSVGDELLCGDIADTNSTWLERLAGERGHGVVAVSVEADDPIAISHAVERFRASVDVLLVTGGLGPTLDDVTRDGVAAALGRRLHTDAKVLESLRRFWDRPLDAGSERQADFPSGARVLPNPVGTAPGFVLRYGLRPGEPGGFTVACLPGVPSEMRPMATALFDELLGRGERVPTLRIRACGLPESEVGARLADLMEEDSEAVDIGITVSQAVLTVSIRGSDAPAMEAVRQQVCERLGDAVFGFGTEGAHEGNHEGLPDCVVRMLAERGMKIATAESCTGGLLAGALTAVPGASEVFDDGRVCYSHEAKIRNLGVPAELLRDHGAVSTAVAESMARGVLEASGSDIAISITGVAGPGGGSPNKPVGSVIFGLADKDIVRTRERRWLGTREEIRAKSVTWALDLVRRRLLERD